METLITLCVCAAWLPTCPCLPGTPSKAKSTGGAQRGRKGRKEGGEGRGKVCLIQGQCWGSVTSHLIQKQTRLVQ